MGYKRYFGSSPKRIIFLNCRIITTEGKYNNKKIDLKTVKEICKDKNIISAIGHEATAKILTELLEFEIPVNRIHYKQGYDDIAIVFQLRDRIPEGKILNKEEIEKIGYDFFVMFRIAG
jgi:hypothetical protein